jgi:hypothetical protein
LIVKLGPMTGAFEKKDEAKAFAPWWGRKAGDTERVLPPYSALRRRGNTVACLGREEDEAYAYFGSEWEGPSDTWNETCTDHAMTLFEPARYLPRCAAAGRSV